MTSRGPDVVVLGAGIHGCATARALALRGRLVHVLERSVPGAEASSVAGGILGPNLEVDAPGPMLDLCRNGLELYPDWVRALTEESGVPIEFARCGGLKLAFTDEAAKGLGEQAFRLGTEGVDHELLRGAPLRTLEAGLPSSVRAGLHIPGESRVDAKALIDALAQSCRRLGVRFVRDEVLRIERDGRRLAVRCRGGDHVANDVVVAAGGWSATIPGTGLAADAVQPVRGQIVSVRMPAPPCRNVIFGERGYVVPRADGRALLGATVEWEGFRKEATVGGVREVLDAAMQILPSLSQAAWGGVEAGFRPHTPDGLPLIGAGVTDGLWFTTGHYRNGILLAPSSSDALARAMCGEPLALDLRPFSPKRVSMEEPTLR